MSEQKEKNKNVKISVPIEKIHEEQQLVFGWAYVCQPKGSDELATDYDNHSIEPVELELAAYEFVRNYGWASERHKDWGGVLVESIVFTEEKIERLDLPEDSIHIGWWVGFHIPDPELFAKIKSGEYKMLSIGGSAVVED